MAGHNINQIDIAPRFAGVLMGISNTAGTLPGFLGPQIAKLIAQEVSVAIVNTDARSSSLLILRSLLIFTYSLVSLLVQSPT